MARFKPEERSQGLFLEVNLYEQLVPGTFGWTLDYLIDRMDLSIYEQNYNNERIQMRFKMSPVEYLITKNGRRGFLSLST